MAIFKQIVARLSLKERRWFIVSAIVFLVALVTETAFAIHDHSVFVPVEGGSYREGFVGQPIALNPVTSNNPIDQEISALLFSRFGNLMNGYEVSDDGREYILKLKEDLLWSDDEPLTSDDVVFTIKTLQNPETRSPLQKSWQGVAVERVSQLQVKLTLLSPYVFFADAIVNLPVIPKHIYGSIPVQNFRLSGYNLEPVGSGPYQFEKFTKRKDGFITQYHFTVNDNYYGERPYIRDFYFNFFQTMEDLGRSLAKHDINAFGTSAPLSQNISDMKGLVIKKVPMPNYYAIFFNQNSNPLLRDDSVRKALIAAVDQKTAVERTLEGNAIPIFSPHLIFGDDGIQSGAATFDPERARELVSAFKTKNKNERIEIALSVPDAPFLKNIAEYIRNVWMDAGIDEVAIRTFNSSDPTDATVKSRDYEALLFGNALENPEDLFPFWHSSQRTYPGFNLSLYSNQKVDTAIETARQSGIESRRTAQVIQETSLIMADAPALFLFSLPYTYVHTPSLKGFSPNTLGTPPDRFNEVRQWYVAEVRVIQ